MGPKFPQLITEGSSGNWAHCLYGPHVFIWLWMHADGSVYRKVRIWRRRKDFVSNTVPMWSPRPQLDVMDYDQLKVGRLLWSVLDYLWMRLRLFFGKDFQTFSIYWAGLHPNPANRCFEGPTMLYPIMCIIFVIFSLFLNIYILCWTNIHMRQCEASVRPVLKLVNCG